MTEISNYPFTVHDIALVYFFVITTFLLINVIWDIFSKVTPRVYLSLLERKIPVLFAASTMAGGILLLISVVNQTLFELLGHNPVPIITSGFASILVSIGSISPHPRTEKNKND